MRRIESRRSHRIAGVAATLVALGASGTALARGDATNGEKVYVKRCEQCHGKGGDGKGPAWEFMLPRPRVFAGNASYKFRTTPSGALPTEQDLFDVVTEGIPGTSMPGFTILPEGERWDVVAYIRTLTDEFSDEDYLGDAVPMPELTGDPQPHPVTEESLAKGKELYLANKCNQCHGELGRGNGPSWPDLKDDWQNPILPANLTNRETFRGGASAFDIYRTISTGLNGTPMPAYVDSISAEDRWDLVNYILALGPAEQSARDEVVKAKRVDALPEDGASEVWNEAPAARFPTLPNVIEPPRLFWSSVEFVTVQALFTDTEVALRVQWDDRDESKGPDADAAYADRDVTIHKATNHPDQLAVQFPSKVDPAVRPYFLLGDGKRSVNLWWWRADTGRIEERNAKGIGAITTQPEKSQTVAGSVTYEDGRYTFYARRALETPDTRQDVQIAAGTFVPIAFHVWNGSRGEVGARRSLTTWYWLYLEPPLPETVYTYPPFAFFFSLGLLLLLVRGVRKKYGAAPEA